MTMASETINAVEWWLTYQARRVADAKIAEVIRSISSGVQMYGGMT